MLPDLRALCNVLLMNTALAQFTLIWRNRRSSSGFAHNLRTEVSKQDKIYFGDLGLCNGAIDNLKP